MDALTEQIIGAAIEAHRELGGPGLLESVYEEAFCFELQARGLPFKRQLECPIVYKNRRLSSDLRIDVLVDDRIVVECKAVSEYNPLFAAQCRTYLRLMNLRFGLVINFGMAKLTDGVKRVVNGYGSGLQ